jgi:site-specific DNA recombinase
VVRQVCEWLGGQRLSLGDVCRRLRHAGERPRTGRTVWDRRVVWERLNKPASMGSAAFGKTRHGPRRPRRRAQRGQPLHPRQAPSTSDVPREDWTPSPVPALVDPAVFAAGQAQLQANRRHARQSRRGARYLLQGLLQGHHGG